MPSSARKKKKRGPVPDMRVISKCGPGRIRRALCRGRDHLTEPGAQLLTLLGFAFFFFNDPVTTEIFTLSLHDALPISLRHSGHLRVLGSGDWRRRMREVSTFTGLTTKKNRAKATVRNATRAFRKSP